MSNKTKTALKAAASAATDVPAEKPSAPDIAPIPLRNGGASTPVDRASNGIDFEPVRPVMAVEEPPSPSCGNCIFFVTDKPADYVGQCREGAPVPILMGFARKQAALVRPGESDQVPLVNGFFPVTNRDTWCGKHPIIQAASRNDEAAKDAAQRIADEAARRSQRSN